MSRLRIYVQNQPAARLAVVVIGFAFVAACTTVKGQAATSEQSVGSETSEAPSFDFDDELQARQERYQLEAHLGDPSFDYTPGFVHPLSPDDIAVDPASGTLRVTGEYVAILETGFEVRDFYRESRLTGIDLEIIGVVPTFGLVQFRTRAAIEELQPIMNGFDSVVALSTHWVQSANQSLGSTERTPVPGWHIASFGISSMWGSSTGKGARVAIVDSGIDSELSVFEDRIVAPYSVVTGSDRYEDEVFYRSGDVTRVVDHGTRVASVVGARRTDAWSGLGVAPEAEIMPIQVLGFSVYDETIVTNDLMVIEGIARAIEFNADVINLSIGTDYTRLLEELPEAARADEALVNRLAARASLGIAVYERALSAAEERNIAVVVSAGNDQLPALTQALATHRFTIAVGAIGPDASIASFSNHGDRVDAYAPGEDLSVYASGGEVFLSSGTSFSAPYVTGMIALAKSAGLDVAPYAVRNGLRRSNAMARASILPASPIPLFMPIAFANELGADLELSGVENGRLLQFHDRYQQFYINEDDSPFTQVQKIAAYYNRHGVAPGASDAETQYAAELIPSILWHLSSYVSAGAPADYEAAILISHSSLSSDQLELVAEEIPYSDFIAIVMARHEFRPSLPALRWRLEHLPNRFNANTLRALAVMDDADAIPVMERYLEAMHDRSEFKIDEDRACLYLVQLDRSIHGRVSNRTMSLVLRSLDRLNDLWLPHWDINAISDSAGNYPYRVLDSMSWALATVGRTEGLALAIHGLRALDLEREPPEWYYQRFQATLNEHTNIGVRYNYRAPRADRTRQLDRFETELPNLRYVRGRFE